MYSSNNCFFKLFMRIWDFMTPRSSMNLRILKSNKDEKAYRKWNQTTAQVSTCPSVNFSNRKKKKKITLKVNVSRSVVSNSCNPMDCSLPGCSVHGILQAKILEWVWPFPSPGDLPNPGLLHCRQILYHLSHQGRPKFCWILKLVFFVL